MDPAGVFYAKFAQLEALMKETESLRAKLNPQSIADVAGQAPAKAPVIAADVSDDAPRIDAHSINNEFDDDVSMFHDASVNENADGDAVTYEHEKFVNDSVSNLCWLHSLTQAIVRVMNYPAYEAQGVKAEIFKHLPVRFHAGRQEDAAEAMIAFLESSVCYKRAFKPQQSMQVNIFCLSQDENHIIEEHQEISHSYIHENEGLDNIFSEPPVLSEQEGTCGGTSETELSKSFAGLPAYVSKRMFPGYAAILENNSGLMISEKYQVVNPSDPTEIFDLVAVIRHTNIRNRASGHYFVDIVDYDLKTVWRIDDCNSQHPQQLRWAREKNNGFLYFFVRHENERTGPST